MIQPQANYVHHSQNHTFIYSLNYSLNYIYRRQIISYFQTWVNVFCLRYFYVFIMVGTACRKKKDLEYPRCSLCIGNHILCVQHIMSHQHMNNIRKLPMTPNHEWWTFSKDELFNFLNKNKYVKYKTGV